MGVESKVIEVSKLRNWDFCPYSFFLDLVIKANNIPMTYYLARRIKLRDYFAALFREQKRLGPELIHIEDMPAEELVEHLAFRSAESFASAMSGRWQFLRNNDYTVQGRRVVWRTEKEKWNSHEDIYNACYNYFDKIATHGAPILAYNDTAVSFFFRGEKYNLSIDEFRRGLIVSPNDPRKNFTKKEIEFGWQTTAQVLAFCRLAHDYESFRLKLGIDEKLARSWTDDNPVSEDVRVLHYSLADGEFIETTRKPVHVEEFMEFIRESHESAVNAVQKKEFPPNHSNCYICKYNVVGPDNKPVCKERNPKTRPMWPSKD